MPNEFINLQQTPYALYTAIGGSWTQCYKWRDSRDVHHVDIGSMEEETDEAD